MTTKLAPAFALLTLAGFALRPAAAHADVMPLDTFTFALTGFNNTSGNGIFISSSLTGTFGLTQTFANAALGGQTVTLTSSETIGVPNTTDTFTISVPTNFVPTGTTFTGSGGSGQTINFIELDLGELNGGTNPVNFLTAHPTVTSAGSALYNGGTLSVSAPITLGNGNQSLAYYQAVSSGTNDISQFAIRSFTATFTYPTVPEPSTYALLAVAGGAGALGLARRRRAARA